MIELPGEAREEASAFFVALRHCEASAFEPEEALVHPTRLPEAVAVCGIPLRRTEYVDDDEVMFVRFGRPPFVTRLTRA